MKKIYLLLLCIPSCMDFHEPKQYSYHHAEFVEHGFDLGVIIDHSVQQKNMAEIARAVDEWNITLNGNIILHFDSVRSTDDILIKEIADDDPLASDKKRIACVNNIGGRLMSLVSSRINDIVYGVVLHEMGHSLGSGHTEKGLMFNTYRAFPCVDYDAAVKVANYNKFDVNTMKYCFMD